MMNRANRVGVLAGGESPERDVSLMSGNGVYQALISREIEAELIQVDALDDLVTQLREVDVAFNCLHGGAGEDGTVQLLLEVLGIPCIGSGPLASMRAMNKAASKDIFRSLEIPTPAGVVADAGNLEVAVQASKDIGFPLILKPVDAGSTIGVHRVADIDALRDKATLVLEDFDQVLIEQYISGRELTVGILLVEEEEKALPVIEIQFPDSTFDYEAKYTDGVAEFLAPAPLSSEVAERLQTIALRAHQALGCFGFSRVDFRLSDEGVPYVLEVNSLPGMTPLSDLPRAASLVGIEYADLVEIMLSTATMERHSLAAVSGDSPEDPQA